MRAYAIEHPHNNRHILYSKTLIVRQFVYRELLFRPAGFLRRKGNEDLSQKICTYFVWIMFDRL